MLTMPMPMRMLVLAIAGWVNQEQREAIEYFREEVRVLSELHGTKRLLLSVVGYELTRAP